MYASIFSLKGENAFKPISTVWTILFAMPFDWGWYGGVLYGIHPILPDHDTKLSSQNSSALSVTMVLAIPFLANIVLNICLTVVAFPSLTLITSCQPERESTKIKNKPMSWICAWSIWIIVHGAPSLGHVCILVYLNVLISILLCVPQHLYNTLVTKPVISIFFALQWLCHEYHCAHFWLCPSSKFVVALLCLH